MSAGGGNILQISLSVDSRYHLTRLSKEMGIHF